MFYRDEMLNDYFYWLLEIISNGHEDSYLMLLKQLFDTTFVAAIDKDVNRAHDGLDLRYQYSVEMGVDLDISSPCSVLEMMIALATRCENDVMYDPAAGDRTYIWFWVMIENLGLLDMTDALFNKLKVKVILSNFMNRNYEPDGRGGLFYVPGTDDMRTTEIWYQMNTFLHSLAR